MLVFKISWDGVAVFAAFVTADLEEIPQDDKQSARMTGKTAHNALILRVNEYFPFMVEFLIDNINGLILPDVSHTRIL
jgi:hypothetical protein